MCSECEEDSDFDEDAYYERRGDVYRMQMERFKIFEAQDQENGHFDLALEIHGRMLYVHKYFLAAASETFSAMVAYRWSKNAEVIKIENPAYSYDDIYLLVKLLYSGKSAVTKDNVFVLTDVAEFFGVSLLKERCDNFLADFNIVVEELEKLVEFSQRYSMYRFKCHLRTFVPDNFKAIIDGKDFLTHKKPFIEYLSTFTKQFFEEEEFFIAAFDWASFQALIASIASDGGDFDFQGYMKAQLDGVSPNIKYSLLNFKFVKEFIQIYNIIASCQRENDEEEECFMTLYKMAEIEAKVKQEATIDEMFSVKEVIKEELAAVLSKVNFHVLEIKFLMEFVVEQGFELDYIKLHTHFLNSRKLKKEEAFKNMYELAQKQVLKKSFLELGFCLADEVKKELAGVLPQVSFAQMDVNFLMDFVVDREIPFSLAGLYNFLIYFREIKGDRVVKKKVDDIFQALYHLAKRRVLIKNKTLLNAGFDLIGAIKEELAEVLPRVNFHLMKITFLNEFVVERGFDLPFIRLYDYFVSNFNREYAFETVYQLAEKQVLKRQERLSNSNFNLINEVKEELNDLLDEADFHLMDTNFLMEFVVKREISFSFYLLHDYLLSNKKLKKEEAFKIVYQLAEKLVLQRQKTSPVADFNLFDAVKEELDEFLVEVDFGLMEISFLMEFVVERELTFSFDDFYDTLLIERKFKMEDAFKIVYELAEKQVLKKQKTLPVENFKLIDAVKKELVDLLPNIEFRQMNYDFLMTFVVDHEFFLSTWDLQFCMESLKTHYGNQQQLFNAIFKLAEKQVALKQKLSVDKNFNYYDAIRNELSAVRGSFDFTQMSPDFLMELVLGKGLLFLSATMFRKYVSRTNYGNAEELFKAVYILAEKVALEKQKASNNPNFNIHKSIKDELLNVRASFKFAQMSLGFLKKFVAGKGLLTGTILRDVFLKSRKECDNEEKCFKAVHKLAEQEALEEQNAFGDDDFNLMSAIKVALTETIPVVNFCDMSKEFMNEFVVKNGILTEKQAHRVFYTCVEVKSHDQIISGVFKDVYDIMKAIPVNGYYSTPRQWNKLRFSRLKFTVPSTPSTVNKMKGAEWFLCLEEDGILAVKHHTVISKVKDYLIAEMKADKLDFKFSTLKAACLTSSFNNV